MSDTNKTEIETVLPKVMIFQYVTKKNELVLGEDLTDSSLQTIDLRFTQDQTKQLRDMCNEFIEFCNKPEDK